MTIAASPPTPSSTASSSMVLQGIAWTTFQALVRDLASAPGKRLTYNNGVLEIWMPSPPHESYKRWLGRLIEIVTEELDIEIRSLSVSTWSCEDLAKGVEADECYYIQHEAAIRGKMSIDLRVDPPPDLAIEIDITSLSLPRLPIYAALGIPEIWQFDGKTVAFLTRSAGHYQTVDRSQALPLLTVETVQSLLDRARDSGETSWARVIRQWVRAA